MTNSPAVISRSELNESTDLSSQNLGTKSLSEIILNNRPGKIYLRECTPAQTPFVSIEDFDLTFFNGSKVLGHFPNQTIVKWREGDAAIVAPFFRNQEGNLEIILMRRLALGAGRRIWQLPKRYVAGPREYDLDSTTENLLSKLKIETPSKSPVFDISGAMTSLPGLTPERMILKALDLGLNQPTTHRFVYDRFYGPIELRSFATRDVIRNGLNGRMHSLEALYSALRLERRTAAPNDAHPTIDPFLQSAPVHSYSQMDSVPIVGLEKLEDYLWGNPPEGVASSVIAKPSEQTAEKFVEIKHFEVTQMTRCDDNQIMHATRGERVEVIGQDRQIMVLSFVRGPEGIYLLCNIGTRESAGRQLSHHFIQDDETERGVEPFWFGADRSLNLSEIKDRFEDTTGAKLTGKLVPIGTYYLSPEFVNLKTEIYIAPVDPTSIDPNAIKLQHQVLIPLNDINAGLIEGTVKSLPLAVGSELIARALGYTLSDPRHCRTKEEREDFERLKNKGGEFRRFLAANFGDVTKKLQRSTTHQRLIELAYNRGFDFKTTDSDFYAVVPEYGLVPRESNVETLSFIQHDIIHGLQGNLNPWNFEASGAPRLMNYKSYRDTILLDESHAVHFSESVMARRLGYDTWRKASGKVALGDVLEHCGFETMPSRLKAVEEICSKGRIPPEIVNHPSYQNRYREVVLQFLSFYVRDLKNTKVAYEYWRQHPTVAKIVAELNPRFTSSPKDYRKNLKTIVDDVRDLSNRGMNPIRSELNRLREVPLLKLGIRVAYLRDHTSDRDLLERCDAYLTQITEIGQALTQAERRVRGLVQSKRNVAASRVRNRKREEIGTLGQQVEQLISDNLPILPDAVATQLKRDVPLWDAPVDLEKERWERVYELEKASIDAAAHLISS